MHDRRDDRQQLLRLHRAEITPQELRPYGYTPLVYPYGAPLALDTREPLGAAMASGLTFLAGLWLVLAPLTLGYDRPEATPEAVVNDLVVGAVVIVMASLSAASTYRRREEEPDEREEGTNG